MRRNRLLNNCNKQIVRCLNIAAITLYQLLGSFFRRWMVLLPHLGPWRIKRLSPGPYRYLAVLLMVLGASPAFAQNQDIKGVVFFDKNDNGRFDRGERGLKNIPVSNGESVCLTNKKGVFNIYLPKGSSLFPILPSGYTLSGSIKNAQFRSPSDCLDLSSCKVAFPLVKEQQNETFKIGAIGDVQIDDLQQAHYTNRTIMAELAARDDLLFNILLGDLVNDNMNLQPYVEGMLNCLSTPSWVVYGNHDRHFQGTYQDSVFNAYYGASHYAFNYSRVHFIVLNNVWSEGGRAYEGRISDKQLRFISNDLQLVPKNKLVVICQHIPLLYTKNNQSLLDLLGERNVLVLSGHTHRIGRHIFSKNIAELTVGATCGSWWTGERDVKGIPSALMQDGSPRNYFVIHFKKDDYEFSFKGIGLDEKQQMNIWISNQDTLDHHIQNLNEIKGGVVLANIYGASDSTLVFMQVNSGKWMKMEPVKQVAPAVNRQISMNREKVYPTSYSKRIPLRNSSSRHLWKGVVSDSLTDKINSVQIKASDNYGFSATGKMLFIKR